MGLKEKFGKRIKYIRKSLGLSQEKFAELVNMQQKAISYTENGRTFPMPENIDNIVEALKMNYSELFDFETKKSSKNTTKDSLHLYIDTLDDNDAAYFLTCIKAFVKLKKHK